MSPRVSLGGQLIDIPFEPGIPRCHHCGALAPEGIPEGHARCESCHLLLHACRNCLLVMGRGCLIRSPFRWPAPGLPGQYCPEFIWGRDEPLDERDILDASASLG